jgi:hypothetical protein
MAKLGTALFLSLTASAALTALLLAQDTASGSIPVPNTNWRFEAPEGFSEKKSDQLDYELIDFDQASQVAAVIVLNEGFRKKPVACPKPDSDPQTFRDDHNAFDKVPRIESVPPLTKAKEGSSRGHVDFFFHCPLPQPGAIERRGIIFDGKTPEGSYLSVTLSYLRAGPAFVPDSEVPANLLKAAQTAFSRVCGSLRFKASPIEPWTFSTSADKILMDNREIFPLSNLATYDPDRMDVQKSAKDAYLIVRLGAQSPDRRMVSSSDAVLVVPTDDSEARYGKAPPDALVRAANWAGPRSPRWQVFSLTHLRSSLRHLNRKDVTDPLLSRIEGDLEGHEGTLYIFPGGK